MTGAAERSAPLQLSVTGRSPIELSYIEQGPSLFLVATDSAALWARESLLSTVRVVLPDGRVEARNGHLETDPARVEEILAGFRDKYGEAVWQRYFRGRARVVVLEPAASARVRTPEEVVREEFDAIASHYTGAVEQNPFRLYLRTRSERRLREIFSGSDKILELGPGTGLETLGLLRTGHSVLAVDISTRMIDELRRRAESAGVGRGLETRVGAIADLSNVLADVPSGSIGGAVSTFGALNLEPNLERLPDVLARVLAPGARFFAGVLSRWGISSVAYLAASGHMRAAVARCRAVVVVDGFRYPLAVRPFTSRQFAGLFRSHFVPETVEAASVLVPPYWSDRLYGFWGRAGRQKLARLDERLAPVFLFRDTGEYVFVTLRRTEKA